MSHFQTSGNQYSFLFLAVYWGWGWGTGNSPVSDSSGWSHGPHVCFWLEKDLPTNSSFLLRTQASLSWMAGCTQFTSSSKSFWFTESLVCGSIL